MEPGCDILIPPEYEAIAIWVIIGTTVPIASKLINWFLSPNYETIRPSKSVYECGEKPIGEAQRRYNFSFFSFAIVFVLFDVLSVFLLTFALIFRDPSVDMVEILIIISIFTLLPVLGLIFWMKKNEILWS